MDREFMQERITFFSETHKEIMKYTEDPKFGDQPLEAQALYVAAANSIASAIVAFQAFEYLKRTNEEKELMEDESSIAN